MGVYGEIKRVKQALNLNIELQKCIFVYLFFVNLNFHNLIT